ncbi:hypothetical protein AURDEDRAFT_185688, partial [Auricularia subglabra TFB-10046 SS5]
MSVLAAPRLPDRISARNAVVLFSIDPVAAIAKLKDPAASAAAALIPRRKYLAIVEMIVNVDWNKPPTRQPLTYKFHFAARHLPEPASTCLALSPGPYARGPILPCPALPWDDCYVFTLNGFSARITAIHHADTGKICTVSDGEMQLVLAAWAEDLESLRAEHAGSHDDAEQDMPLILDGGSSFGLDESAASLGPLLYESGSDFESTTEEEDEDDYDIHFYGEIWLDLTIQEKLGTFDDWSDASDRLHDIKEASRRRAMLAELSHQPETTKWAENVASAGSLDLPQDPEPLEHGSDVSEADGALTLAKETVEPQFQPQIAGSMALEPLATPSHLHRERVVEH